MQLELEDEYLVWVEGIARVAADNLNLCGLFLSFPPI